MIRTAAILGPTMADEQQGPERHINIHFDAGEHGRPLRELRERQPLGLRVHDHLRARRPRGRGRRDPRRRRLAHQPLAALHARAASTPWRTTTPSGAPARASRACPSSTGRRRRATTQPSAQRAPASNASRSPIRSTVGGWVAMSATSQRAGRGRRRCATRDAALEADERLGRVGQAQRVAVGARLDPPRELVGHDGHAEADDRDRRAPAPAAPPGRAGARPAPVAA